MSASIFNNRQSEPDEAMLSGALGETRKCLDKLRSFIQEEYGELSPEWKFYGPKSGWVLKLFHKKRNVLFIVPCDGYFRAAFTFGEKAVEEVAASELPDRIKEELLDAKKYAEGRTIQLDVKTEEQCENILRLIRIKLDN